MSNSEQSIEELQLRYNGLNTRKIQAETNLKNAEKQLDQLKQQAREKYGTDDVEQLREQLTEMRNENDRKRREYQAELDRIDGELTKVDQEYSDATEGNSVEGETE